MIAPYIAGTQSVPIGPVADALGVHKKTVHEGIVRLIEAGAIERLSGKGRYKLLPSTPKMAEPAKPRWQPSGFISVLDPARLMGRRA